MRGKKNKALSVLTPLHHTTAATPLLPLPLSVYELIDWPWKLPECFLGWLFAQLLLSSCSAAVPPSATSPPYLWAHWLALKAPWVLFGLAFCSVLPSSSSHARPIHILQQANCSEWEALWVVLLRWVLLSISLYALAAKGHVGSWVCLGLSDNFIPT